MYTSINIKKNNIEPSDVIDINIKHGFINLVGRRRCFAVSRKIACKCNTASVLALIIRFFHQGLIVTSVNISNELNFSDVYRSVNYSGSLSKFT